MSNDYLTKLLVDERLAGFRHEAEEERLAHLARREHSHQPRWWERLMLFRSRRSVGVPATNTKDLRRPRGRQHAVTLGGVRD